MFIRRGRELRKCRAFLHGMFSLRNKALYYMYYNTRWGESQFVGTFTRRTLVYPPQNPFSGIDVIDGYRETIAVFGPRYYIVICKRGYKRTHIYTQQRSHKTVYVILCVHFFFPFVFFSPHSLI